MRKLNYISLALSIAVSCATFAVYADDARSNCESLEVQVLNKTNSDCLFQNYRATQGYLININPNAAVIPMNGTQTFNLRQNLVHGPTVEIDYNCNGQKITIESHQNFCYLSSGKVEGRILAADNGITATNTSREGSYYWSINGSIYWAIQNK